jgi:hypothetical protein
MTPAEILEIAMSQFTPLYIVDSGKLETLLRRALLTYQDKAGVIKTVTSVGTDSFVEIPDDMLSVIHAADAGGRYHEVVCDDTNLSVTPDASSVPPYTFHYFVNLREYDIDADLPAGIVGVLIDYVVALIDIPNTERARAISLATGRQAEFATISEMINRKDMLEAYMAENMAIVPMMTVC